MKHKRKNRFLSLLLAVFMTVPLLFGMTVYAEEDSVNAIDPPAITLNKSTVYMPLKARILHQLIYQETKKEGEANETLDKK